MPHKRYFTQHFFIAFAKISNCFLILLLFYFEEHLRKMQEECIFFSCQLPLIVFSFLFKLSQIPELLHFRNIEFLEDRDGG